MTLQTIITTILFAFGVACLVFQEKLSFEFERMILKNHVATAYRLAGIVAIVLAELMLYGYLSIRY